MYGVGPLGCKVTGFRIYRLSGFRVYRVSRLANRVLDAKRVYIGFGG